MMKNRIKLQAPDVQITKSRLFSGQIIKLWRIKTWNLWSEMNHSTHSKWKWSWSGISVYEQLTGVCILSRTWNLVGYQSSWKPVQYRMVYWDKTIHELLEGSIQQNLLWINKTHGFNCPMNLQPIIISDIHTKSGGRKRHKGSRRERHVTWLTLSIFPKDQNQCWK